MQIAIDDVKLEVNTAGDGDPVVLLHGFPFAHDIWNSQIERLREKHFVVAPDLRGLGKSSVPPGPYLMESLAGDIAAVMDALGVERANFVGHSLGGYVALAFFRMFSERVSRLCLVSSRIGADSPQTAQGRLELADEAERVGISPVVESSASKVFAPQTPLDTIARAREIMERTDPRGAAAMLRGMAQRVPSDDLIEELKIPVLVVAGAHDTIASAEEWRPLISAFPDARLEICERSAHMPMLEEPERLTAAVSHFLQSRGARS